MIISRLSRAQLSYDTFDLVFYTDLAPFYQLEKTISQTIQHIQNITSTSKFDTFNTTTIQLLHEMDLISQNNEIVESFRSKRFVLCEFCGTINHYLTGVMDANTARGYDEIINNIANQTLEQHKLAKNQSLIVQAALNYNKNTFLKIENAINIINSEIENQNISIQRVLRTLQAKTDLHTLIQSTQLAIQEVNRLSHQIKKSFTNLYAGKLPELIPTELLTHELQRIAALLNQDQQLPIDPNTNNALLIFKSATFKSTLYNQRIIIKITIPIAEREQLFLYKATPIPILINETQFITTPLSPFFLLNTDQTKYIPISKKQLNLGTLLPNGEMLYRPTSTILLKDEICEWKILKDPQPAAITQSCHFTPWLNPNTIIPILENKIIFISTTKTVNIFEKCDGGDYNFRPIRGRGTITLDPKCSIRTNDFIIHSHQTITLNVTQIIAPTININIDIPFPDINQKLSKANNNHTIIIHDQTELQNIIDTSNQLVERTGKEFKLQQIHYDSNSTSIFSGLLSGILSSTTLLIILGGIILLTLRKYNPVNFMLSKILGQTSNIQHSNGTVIIDMQSH